MLEFNSLNDWNYVGSVLKRSINNIENYSNRVQLVKLLNNLQLSVTELSRADVTMRRTYNSTDYLAKLATVREELHHLQQWLTFATLVDTKSEI